VSERFLQSFLVMASAVILIQSTATLRLRIGDIGKSWTDSEAAGVMKMVSPAGPGPWLLYVYYGTFTDGLKPTFHRIPESKKCAVARLYIYARQRDSFWRVKILICLPTACLRAGHCRWPVERGTALIAS
jgi:hypothetical protein